MSRERILGSVLTPYGTPNSTSPLYALICQEGEPSTTATTGFGRGFSFDPDALCRIWGGVKSMAFAVDWTYSGTTGGHTITTQASFSGNGAMASTTEADVRAANLSATPPLWELVVTGSLTVTTDGVPVTTSPSFTIDLQVSGTASLSAGTPSITPAYYYRTDTNLWLPNFDLNHTFASAIRWSSTVVLTPGGSEQQLTKTAQFNGNNFDLSVVIPSYATFSAFSCTVDFHEYFPYSGASGAIWNTSTGAELQSHSTPND